MSGTVSGHVCHWRDDYKHPNYLLVLKSNSFGILIFGTICVFQKGQCWDYIVYKQHNTRLCRCVMVVLLALDPKYLRVGGGCTPWVLLGGDWYPPATKLKDPPQCIILSTFTKFEQKSVSDRFRRSVRSEEDNVRTRPVGRMSIRPLRQFGSLWTTYRYFSYVETWSILYGIINSVPCLVELTTKSSPVWSCTSTTQTKYGSSSFPP